LTDLLGQSSPPGERSAPSLRDRRRDFLAAEIRRAALRLFAAGSFDEVTVEDIATAAGIAQRTFFRYFASKDDVVLDFRRHLDDRLVEALARRPAGEGPVTALRKALVATSTVRNAEERALALQHGRILADSPDLHARAEGRRSAGPSRIVPQLAERMGVNGTDGRAELVAVAMTAVAAKAFDRWVADGGPGDPGRRVNAALLLLEKGLAHLDVVRSSRKTRRPA
jgi:AcrR family transcriptional regulator